MKRLVVLFAVALAAAALFGGLVHVVLVATRTSEPAAETVYGSTPQRTWATLVMALAVVGVVSGGVTLVRPGRLGAGVALATGLIGGVNGAWILSVATGGPGSGNGVVGGASALVLGVFGMALGGVALYRTRRTDAAALLRSAR